MCWQWDMTLTPADGARFWYQLLWPPARGVIAALALLQVLDCAGF